MVEAPKNIESEPQITPLRKTPYTLISIKTLPFNSLLKRICFSAHATTWEKLFSP